jgi:elongation of very long chain fatty acids protein 6
MNILNNEINFFCFISKFRYAFKEYTAPARWFIVMNFTVHSFMYSYYALKAMNYRVPRFVSMAITVAQLSQMVGGCAVNLWAYQVSCYI